MKEQTLRDFIALSVLEAIITSQIHSCETDYRRKEKIAQEAYSWAHALLQVREDTLP